MSAATATAAATIEAALVGLDLEWQRLDGDVFAVALPGEKRLKTACMLSVGAHALAIEAFVLRAPEENREGVHAWLLQRNTRMYAVSWAIDGTGDVYLVGRVPLAAIDADEIDRILGSVLENADGSFNLLLRLGFGESIKREWAWRVKNNERLDNLAAFEHFAQRSEGTVAQRSEGTVAQRTEGTVAQRTDDTVAQRTDDTVAQPGA